MITLITGAPGSGKSAALVELLDQFSKDRTLFVDGIKNLAVDHVPLEDATKWPELVPDGALVAIDEVQRVWRPRGPGRGVPSEVQALETHRHRGLDFYLCTQAPRLLDANVRALVGRHVHIRQVPFFGRYWYEWPECSEAVAWRTAPIKRKFRLPKAIFAKYTSASIHIKPVHGFPWMVGVVVLCLVLLASMSWYLYRSLGAKIAPPAAQPSNLGPEANQGFSVGSRSVPAKGLTGAALVVSFVPRVSADPGSAPAYDGLRPVAVVPVVVGGWCAEECRCFTQQGTDAGLSGDACRAWIERRPFNPYAVATVADVSRSDGARGPAAAAEPQ